MYGLTRLGSANYLRALFAAAPRGLLRLNPALGSSSRRCVVVPPSPAVTDDSVNADKIRGEDGEALPENDTYRRKLLPPELLSKNVVMLTCDSSADGGICDVYLVGTCHVSSESKREVESVIEFLKPQVVFLELCSRRKAALTLKHVKVPTMGDMAVAMLIKKQNPFGILYSRHLAKLASELKIVPGAEFSAAYEQAKKYGGKVILGDRPIQITLGRISGKMVLWDMIKFLFQSPSPVLEDLIKKFEGLNFSDKQSLVKHISNMDLTGIEELTKTFPTLMEAILHERDQYMSAKILEVARQHNSVVAVVGRGHLAGIQKNWKQPVELKQLLTVPD